MPHRPYADLKIETPAIPGQDGMLKLSFEVKNTGAIPGQVVPQVYWRQGLGEIAPPEKRLLRFDKLELQPGEAKTVSFAVPVAEFRSLTRDMKWTILPGRIDLQAGDSAESPAMLKGSFEISAK
jgi:beta-glucosidase